MPAAGGSDSAEPRRPAMLTEDELVPRAGTADRQIDSVNHPGKLSECQYGFLPVHPHSDVLKKKNTNDMGEKNTCMNK